MSIPCATVETSDPAMVDPHLISVITPTHRPDAPYLRDAYESLVAQDGVDWEWLVQFDGDDWTAPQWLLEDARVRLESNGKHLGIAMTRNRALMRSHGDLIQTLDADDALLPEALSVLAAAVRSGNVAYAVGTVVLLIDGKPSAATDPFGRPKLPALPFGEIPTGVLSQYWLRHDRMPFAMNGAMWRRDVVLAYGGWSAIQTSEDVALMLPVSEDYAGVYLDHTTFVYRQHDESTMHDPNYFTVARPRDNGFVAEQLKAIAKLRRERSGGVREG